MDPKLSPGSGRGNFSLHKYLGTYVGKQAGFGARAQYGRASRRKTWRTKDLPRLQWIARTGVVLPVPTALLSRASASLRGVTAGVLGGLGSRKESGRDDRSTDILVRM